MAAQSGILARSGVPRRPPQEALPGSGGRHTDPRCCLSSPVSVALSSRAQSAGAPVEAMGSPVSELRPGGKGGAERGTFSLAPFPGALASFRSLTRGRCQTARPPVVSAVREMLFQVENRRPGGCSASGVERFPKEPGRMCCAYTLMSVVPCQGNVPSFGFHCPCPGAPTVPLHPAPRHKSQGPFCARRQEPWPGSRGS